MSEPPPSPNPNSPPPAAAAAALPPATPVAPSGFGRGRSGAPPSVATLGVFLSSSFCADSPLADVVALALGSTA